MSSCRPVEIEEMTATISTIEMELEDVNSSTSSSEDENEDQSDDPPRKSFASKFRRKKITTSRVTQPEVGEGPLVPPDPTPPPTRSQQQSPEQGQTDAPASVPPHFPGHFPGHFPPPSMSPHYPSPDQTHAAPFYPYYPPPSSQVAGPSTGPHHPYPYPYYYPIRWSMNKVDHQDHQMLALAIMQLQEISVSTLSLMAIITCSFNPSRPPIHMIRDIIKNKYDAPYLSWKKIPKPVRDIWFGEFQKEFRWLPEHNTRIRTNFERRGATRLRDMFTDIRKSGQHPNWIGEGVWADLSSAWATPKFLKMREQNKQNRASNCGGLGSSLHTGGSVPHTEHRRRLKERLGREPTPLELHTRTHQHQADQKWVDEKAKKAHSTGEGSSSGSAHISEYHTWSEVVGGRQKGRVYGLGAQGYAIEGSSSTSAFHDVSGAEESVSERVAALTREIEEMRKVQNEMQAELQSYRVQRRQEEEQ
ncbi:hypothetical protein KFK09_011440 [Dendrobium nobile]|uniref:Transposase, Ptta/En/Spm, plant n=1 Tax=Dendrobium nobile TaxID=94219 RepID=A0A8T3BFS9_DENNO|nr:hypothetical protein KFK09_011440 [Dendrobium nobile]